MRMVTTTTRMEFSNTKLVSFANDLESWSDEDDNVQEVLVDEMEKLIKKEEGEESDSEPDS